MKICELCKNPARTRCQPEEVNLCWDCDARVHSANFLAARHLRILLCNVCQSPSPWKASGAKLGPTVSVCAGCAGYEAAVGESGSNIRSGSNNRYEITRGDDESDVDEWDDEEGEEEDDEDDDVVDAFGVDDTEDGDNQVVPRSSSPPPPPATSSSSSEESSSRFSNTDSNVFESTSPTLACKADERRKPMRMLKNAASPRSDEHPGCSSSHPDLGCTGIPIVVGRTSGDGVEATDLDSCALSKKRRTESGLLDRVHKVLRAGLRPETVSEALKRLHQRDIAGTGDTSVTNAEKNKSSKNR